MTLGPTAFAVVLWGAVAAVFGVFVYQVYTLVLDAGWLAGNTRDAEAGGGVDGGNEPGDGP